MPVVAAPTTPTPVPATVVVAEPTSAVALPFIAAPMAVAITGVYLADRVHLGGRYGAALARERCCG